MLGEGVGWGAVGAGGRGRFWRESGTGTLTHTHSYIHTHTHTQTHTHTLIHTDRIIQTDTLAKALQCLIPLDGHPVTPAPREG